MSQTEDPGVVGCLSALLLVILACFAFSLLLAVVDSIAERVDALEQLMKIVVTR